MHFFFEAEVLTQSHVAADLRGAEKQLPFEEQAWQPVAVESLKLKHFLKLLHKPKVPSF